MMPAGHLFPKSSHNTDRLSATRFVVFLTIGLAMLTGVLVGAIGRAGILAPEPIPAAESRAQQLGRAYYDAVDHLLQTGDAHNLMELLSSDFRSQTPESESSASAEQLILEYQSLRTLYPGVRITVSELTASGSLVIASVTTHGTDPGEFTGVEIEVDRLVGHQEILQMRDGRIVERWTEELARPTLLTLAAIEETSMTGVPELRLWRFELFAEDTIHAKSDIVLIVIGGTLLVESLALKSPEIRRYRSGASAPGGIHEISLMSREEIVGGDVLMLPADAALRVRNGSDVPADIVSISGSPSLQTGLHFNTGAVGVTRQLLARGFSLDGSSISQALFIGQASFDSKTSLSIPESTTAASSLLCLPWGSWR